MRNKPLPGFCKKSPLRQENLKTGAKIAVKAAKPLLSGAAKRATGVAGMFLGSVETSSTDQPGTGTHGGTKTGSYNPSSGKYE